MEIHSPSAAPVQAPPAPRHAFAALLALRVLTVLDDNLLRWLAIGIGKRAVEAADHSQVLTIGTAGFVLPFVLLAWLSGWLADRFPKRSVIAWCKFAEILIACLAVGVIARGVGPAAAAGGAAHWPAGLWLLLAALVAIGCQAALLAPSVLGTIPESVPKESLSAANGLFAMLTLVATLAGTAGGNWLADVTPIDGRGSWPGALPAAVTLLGVAVSGWLASFALARRPAADPAAPPPFNAIGRSFADLRELFSSPDLAAAAVGSTFFWALGAMANLNVDQFVAEGGATSQSQVVPFLVVLGAGIGAGSVLAGRWSRHGVNLGLVPMGAAVMTLAAVGLWLDRRPLFVDGAANGPAWWGALAALLFLGLGAGMFDVPLEAHFQEQSPPARRGALLSALNLVVFAGMFLASLLYGAARTPVGDAASPFLTARGVFGGFVILGALATAAAVWCAPRATLRTAVAALVSTVWRYRVRQGDRLPVTGPALVVSNHVSWLDGFVVVLAAARPLRMVVYGPNIRGRFLRMLADQWRFILFEPAPKSIGRALRTMQEGLAAGDAVGIFSEGGISRTGQLLGFKRGTAWILERASAPIVPAHIDGMWGSVLSFSEGRFFRKWPRFPGRGRRRLTVWFDSPLPLGTPPGLARIAIQDLSARAVRERSVEQRDPDRDLASWARRFRHGAGAVEFLRSGRSFDARGGLLPSGAERGSGRNIVVGDEGLRVDWAALSATAEAFDGCCLVRPTDRLISSLAPGDPLFVHLGLFGGPLLGIDATSVSPDADPATLVGLVASSGATLWLARVSQVAAAARAEVSPGRSLEGVVLPIASLAELPAAREASAAFRAAHGVEPVVAFAPGPLGGLVSMNTPPARSVEQETACRSDSLGRVVNGVAVWPAAAIRADLQRDPLDPAMRVDRPSPPALPDGKATLVVAATGPRRADAAGLEPAWFLLADSLSVDDDGFLLPAGGEPSERLPTPPPEPLRRRRPSE